MNELQRFFGPNAGYVVELYEHYQRDPDSVSTAVREYFQRHPNGAVAQDAPAASASMDGAGQLAGLFDLVEAIRARGHLAASFDPLGLQVRGDPLLSPAAHGISDEQLKALPPSAVHSALAEGAASAARVVARLLDTYCGTTGYEFSQVTSPEERRWLHHAVETGQFTARLDVEKKRQLLERLTRVEAFERFLHKTFPGQTWFSIEGNDTLVPLLDEIIRQAAYSDLRTLMMGMTHRGRLNVLAHVFGKAYEDVLAEFTGGSLIESADQGWMRDVKYHMGATNSVPSEDQGTLVLRLLPNPSHLELVNPVVVGAVRSFQESGSTHGAPAPDRQAAMAVLIHGDAGFAGQGIVAETLNLARLAGYSTGGTIHVIVNNQLGFTVGPEQAHSTRYPTDVARGYDIPVVHVNADDPIACLDAARLAFAYRQEFGKDFVVDLVGYRRYGHNEGDEPSFTQPSMYETIRAHEPVRSQWASRLIEESVVTAAEAQGMMDQAFERLRAAKESLGDGAASPNGLPEPDGEATPSSSLETSVAAEILTRLDEELHELPTGFTAHRRLERVLTRRSAPDAAIDWAHAELLAFASILADGVSIRLTGQDSERGTFSQRHAVLHDVRTGGRFVPLQSLPSSKAIASIFNSPLSEQGALGFEYGYSVNDPRSLVLWEAQYGDFINNAQSIIDEFLVSARAKWNQRSGLTLLLPHAYEGQGPNHSSGHLERFLMLAAEENIRVVNPTTAAQYFHVLRRQAAINRVDPRPLAVMTAKSLLRHRMTSSTLREIADGPFHPVIDDAKGRERPANVRRVILCSGKVHVDIASSDQFDAADHIALVRVEELYPFPDEAISRVLDRYKKAREVIWLQEEPRNRGAWATVAPRLERLLGDRLPLNYIGRPERPSPAVGSSALHKFEQEQIIEQAFSSPDRRQAIERGVANVR